MYQEITLLENSALSQRPILSRSNTASDDMFDMGQGDVLKFENISPSPRSKPAHDPMFDAGPDSLSPEKLRERLEPSVSLGHGSGIGGMDMDMDIRDELSLGLDPELDQRRCKPLILGAVPEP